MYSWASGANFWKASDWRSIISTPTMTLWRIVSPRRGQLMFLSEEDFKGLGH
jgi:hypothetical protein